MNSKPKRLLVWLLLTTTCVAAEAQSLGRLFTTPAQRLALERQRTALFEEMAIQELRVPEQIEVEEGAPAELGLVQLTGIVRRADGRHTVWLNNVPIDESELPVSVRLDYLEGRAVLYFKVLGNEYPLKPGQSLDAATGQVREAYEISAEQSQAIRAEVEARAESFRLQAAQRIMRSSAPDDTPDTAPDADQQSDADQDPMVQSVIEGLRILQQLQTLQQSQGGTQ